MGRVIAIHQGPDGRHRPGAPVRDDRFTPVIEWVIQAGEFGNPWLVPLKYTPDHDTADMVRQSLYNAARYYCGCGLRSCCRKFSNLPTEKNPDGGCPRGGQRVSCQAKLVRLNGHIRVEFKFFDKRESMREVVAKYGPDPSKWPYNPWAKKIKEG
jgi:hypothetical protein